MQQHEWIEEIDACWHLFCMQKWKDLCAAPPTHTSYDAEFICNQFSIKENPFGKFLLLAAQLSKDEWTQTRLKGWSNEGGFYLSKYLLFLLKNVSRNNNSLFNFLFIIFLVIIKRYFLEERSWAKDRERLWRWNWNW